MTWKQEIANRISLFQCSSASRKFLNLHQRQVTGTRIAAVSVLFSEPKIPQFTPDAHNRFCPLLFQCSSASRKFLNYVAMAALCIPEEVSVLFSEPKIPQLIGSFPRHRGHTHVSVLFSEPKIPQCPSCCIAMPFSKEFQCSSASRKFLNSSATGTVGGASATFQCSSASRKFLNQ